MAEFQLTGERDRLRGTGGDDVFTGGAGTLSRGDFLIGGGGDDVLIAGLANNLSGAEDPRIYFIETLYIDGQGGDLSLRNVRGADAIYADQSSLVLEDVDTLNTSYGARGVESGELVLDFTTDFSGGGDTLSLISEDSNVTFKASSDEQNASIEAIEIDAIGTDGAEQVDVSAFNAIQSITVTGENRLVLDAVSDEFASLDATENAGGVELDDFNSASQDLELLGSQGDDLLLSGTGDDLIEGNDGDDDINAEAGNDTIDGGAGDDTLDGNAGADTITGGEGDDDISGGGGADEASGGEGNDTLIGGNGDDTLSGGAGDDELRGGAGDDRLEAGSGTNVLFGGGGENSFVFADGTDEVRDFNDGLDTLVFADGTSLSTQQDFIDLQDENPEAYVSVEASQVVLSLGGAEVTVLIDTDFLG